MRLPGFAKRIVNLMLYLRGDVGSSSPTLRVDGGAGQSGQNIQVNGAANQSGASIQVNAGTGQTGNAFEYHPSGSTNVTNERDVRSILLSTRFHFSRISRANQCLALACRNVS